jgi:tellurite methyltransferase
MFFCRLASSIGVETRVTPVEGAEHRWRLPDGTVRYLVDEARVMAWTRELGGQLLDPLKTTVVQDQRAMTTWVVRKS